MSGRLVSANRGFTTAMVSMLVFGLFIAVPLACFEVQPAYASDSPSLSVTRAQTGKLVMKKGSKYKLEAKTSKGKLSYKSSKPTVVSVTKKGVLKAKKAGKATITVKAKSGKKATTKKVKVTVVKASKFKKVKGLSAKLSNKTLYVGQNASIALAFSPKKASNRNVVYISDNEGVATVSAAGNVSAKKPGTANITVASCDNKKATSVIAVKVITLPALPSRSPGSSNPGAYTVTFDTDGGSAVPSQKVKTGNDVTKPVDPTKDGYAFAGWFLDKHYSETYDFYEGCYSDLTLYAKWNKATADYFELAADKERVTTGLEDDSFVTFTLSTDLQVDGITLYDADTMALVLMLSDAGNYGNGDDDEIAGDGVYTGRMFAGSELNGEKRYVARYGAYTSNEATVEYIDPISDDMLDSMEATDEAISELVNSANYAAADESGRFAQAKEVLTGLEDADLIVENSIDYDSENSLLTFEYGDGVLGGVALQDFKDDENGMAAGKPGAPTVARPDAPAISRSVKAQSTDRAIEDGVLGQVLILNAFPAFETDEESIEFRTDFYEDLQDSWSKKGFDVALDTDVTVDDFKCLDSYDVVSISTHGGVYSWGEGFLWLDRHSVPAICTPEKSNWDNDKRYSYELKNKEIVKVNGRYWILPAFIEDNYSSDDLDETIVLSECCEFVGKGDSYDYSMVNAFMNKSVKEIVAFHNSVYAVYSREFMKTFVDYLTVGDSAKIAYDKAKLLWGDNDKEWFDAHVTDEKYDSSRLIAVPVLRGTTSAKLVHDGIENGDFEDASIYSLVSGRIKQWNETGDSRPVRFLGDAKPYGAGSKYMAAVTTGIGSSSTATLDGGTEGSCISQAFVVPDGVSQVGFDYNFISEEPMEFVGSEYDDSFYVQLVVDEEEAFGETLESINESTWIPVGHVNFPDGDETAFQTGWKSYSFDVSSYAGKIAALRFIVFDKGDSIYDSACLIDNVKLQ